ncbi:MAG: Cof-type HAD-IIB family hydrolase [Bdellovibrionales bacterium]|nr:Cof-type HAD-IIB family hydrolase [Bdellovibrionales bacterium]
MLPMHLFQKNSVRYLFTDIDGTMTEQGKIPSNSYQALWDLYNSGIAVIPVTGRPAGWCDMIARTWPVHGVIGENGALAYHYSEDQKKILRYETISEDEHLKNQGKISKIISIIQSEVPEAKIASDQFTRKFDLAIDFAEDLNPPLPREAIYRIQEIFFKQGAQAKISNIHVNGWFGEYDKLSACVWYCKNWLGESIENIKEKIAFIGDSPNDEPMFEFFQNSFAVNNVTPYLADLKNHPKYLCPSKESFGFTELARHLIFLKNK